MEIIKKFSITEVARLVGVTTETLRAWELNSYIPKSHRRGVKGARYWHEDEVQKICEYRQANYQW